MDFSDYGYLGLLYPNNPEFNQSFAQGYPTQGSSSESDANYTFDPAWSNSDDLFPNHDLYMATPIQWATNQMPESLEDRREAPCSSQQGLTQIDANPSDGLRRHLCIHKDCYKTFRYISQMMRHLKSHGIYACSKCFSTFRNRTLARFHIKNDVCSKACSDEHCRRYCLPGRRKRSCRHLKSAEDQWQELSGLRLKETGGDSTTATVRRPIQHASYLEVSETAQSSDAASSPSESIVFSSAIASEHVDSLVDLEHQQKRSNDVKSHLRSLEGRLNYRDMRIIELEKANLELQKCNHELIVMIMGLSQTDVRQPRMENGVPVLSSRDGQSIPTLPRVDMMNAASISSFEADESALDSTSEDEEMSDIQSSDGL